MPKVRRPRGIAFVVACLGVALALPSEAAAAQESKTVPTKSEHKHTNRLIKSTSPYLLQHAHNPVDWYEWSDEAFEKARSEDKLVFLSIGYSACHWCHVMEHECFETDIVAAALNENFVSIKVDREERPDLDEIYMAYTQASTRRGGWPMSVWLTPDGAPFHAGTYFPQAQFLQLLERLSDTWTNDREKILGGARGARDFFDRWATGPAPAAGVPGQEIVDKAAATLSNYFDRTKGGMRSNGNKFPPSMAMDLMLRVYRRTENAELFEAVEVTLDNMARGGIYDHLGGGICRYSTDPEWLVPHFEKMLYDQGMVSGIFLDAFQVSGKPLYARTAADIFRYVMYDLQSPEGGFYSARDADSGGLEGAFYIWTVEEINQLLGEEDGKLFCAYYDVTARGNWFESRGHAPAGAKNILHISKPPAAFAKLHGMTTDVFEQRLKSWHEKLMPVRAKRTPPSLDDKVLTGWNGLIIASMAKGARVLDEPRFAESAGRAASFILDKLRKDGRLLRTYRSGQARLTAYLSDYAFFIEGLLNLYEATFDRKWLDAAVELTDLSIKYYYDESGGAFFFTANDAEQLLARSKNANDGAIPAGNSVHALNLIRLAVMLDNKDYKHKAESIFRAMAGKSASSPGAVERLLCALDFYHDRVREVAIVGDLASKDTKNLIATVWRAYLPNKVVVHASDAEPNTKMPLLKGKIRMKGQATAYVCEQYRCQLPVTTPEALAKQLGSK